MLEMLKPGIYTGDLRHRRLGPRPHEFTYRVFLALLDIDRIPELMRVSPFASYNRWNWATFAERDHFGDPRLPLRERLARDAAANGLQLPDGPVFLLTHLRYLGYCFNPISFFYCYTASGELEMVLAEVANTFGERHNYWLSAACRIPPVMNATPPAAGVRLAAIAAALLAERDRSAPRAVLTGGSVHQTGSEWLRVARREALR